MTGCGSGPTVIEFEQEPIELTAQRPVERCQWPELREVDWNGQTLIVMDVEGLKMQRSCQVTEQANYDIALTNAESVDSAIVAFNALIDKAQLHNQYAQNELDRVDGERVDKRNELWAYQFLLAAVLIAVAL